MSPGEVFDLAVAYGIHVWPTLMAAGGIALIFLLFTLFIALQGIALVGPPFLLAWLCVHFYGWRFGMIMFPLFLMIAVSLGRSLSAG